jgi:hypothetical protein
MPANYGHKCLGHMLVLAFNYYTGRNTNRYKLGDWIPLPALAWMPPTRLMEDQAYSLNSVTIVPLPSIPLLRHSASLTSVLS